MTLTIEIPDEQRAALTAKARAQGLSAEQYAIEVLKHDLEGESAKPRRHISDVIRENMRDVPPEIMGTLPEDGASQHDHYIYGLPKRDV